MSDGGLFPGSLLASVAGAAWVGTLAVLLGAALLRSACWARGALTRFPSLDRIPPDEAGAPDSTTAPPHAEALPRLCASGVIGCIGWSALVLGASALQWLRPAGVVALAAVVTLLAGAAAGRTTLALVADLMRRPGVAPPPGTPTGRGLASRIALCAVALVPLLALVHASVPTLHYDDLVYHLGLPRQALLTGSWPAEPYFHHAMMPSAWETLFLVPLAMGGGVGPQFLNVAVLAAIAGMAFRLARRGGRSLAAAVVAVLLVGSGVFVASGWTAGNDLAFALALVVGLEFVLSGRMLLAGACAGAAIGIKLAAGPGMFALLVTVLFVGQAGHAGRWREGLRFGVMAAAVSSPWWLRALALTGNPVYPALHGLLGGSPWDKESARLLMGDSAVGAMPVAGAGAFLHGAVALVAHPERLGIPSGSVAVFVAASLAGLVVVSLGRGRVRGGAVLLMFVAASYAGWCATSLMQRFFLAPLVALTPFAAAAVESLLARSSARVAPRLLAGGAVLLAIAGWLASLDGFYRGRGLDPWRILRYRHVLIRDSLYIGAAGLDAGVHLPPDARLLMVAESRIALVPRPTRASSALDPPLIASLLAEARSPDDVPRLLAPHATHLLVNRRAWRHWDEKYGLTTRMGQPGAHLLAWLEQHPPIGRNGLVEVHAIEPPVVEPPVVEPPVVEPPVVEPPVVEPPE